MFLPHRKRGQWWKHYGVSTQGGVYDIYLSIYVLADFAVSAVVPRAARTGLLTNQPFLVWHVVVVRGNGLRVVRY